MWSKAISRCSRRIQRVFYSENFGLKPSNESLASLSDIFNSSSTNSNIIPTETTGLFTVPELNSPLGFEKQQYICTIRTKQLIEEACSKDRTRKIVEIFDEMSNLLCKVADLAEFVRLAHPQYQFSSAAEKTCLTISEIVEKLNTNRRLYDNLRTSVIEGDIVETTEVDNLVGQLFLFDFEQNGIHLSEDLRNEVVELNSAILNIGQLFVSRSDSPRFIKKSNIIPSLQNSFALDGDNVVVTGLFIDSSNPLLRETAYKIYYFPDEQQESLLQDLVECRYQLAKVCGFKSYAERVLRGGVVDNTKDVTNFLEKTSNSIKEFSNLDFKQMSKMKKAENLDNKELAIWDVPYYVLKAKRDWFKVTQEQFCPFFSLGTCMDGLNIIFKNLYGVSLVNCPLMKGECWSNNVYKLAVEHENEGVLGYIYCDFFERPGKQNQDCHFTIRGGKELSDGSYQIPIAVLMLNFRPPTWGTPSLLTPHNVDNLFHEMGHAMHSMLARTKYQHVTGTRCSTDLAEVPSVLMEYFASDPRILRLFAKHYQNSMPIPEEMLQRLCVSKKIFTACETNMQIFYSVLDQLLHSENPVTDRRILMDLQEKYYGLKYVENTAWHLRFSHLVGYGAKYYSYLVSRSVAHSIWHNYFQSDPLNRSSGEQYRRECLAYGGGKNPKKLVTDFLKMEITPDVLTNSLVTEITKNHEIVAEFNRKYKVY